MIQMTLLWVIDPFNTLRWECDHEFCTASAGGDHAETCVDTDMASPSERKCMTPGCDRKARNSGSDGKTLHAYCKTCERRLFEPKA